MQLLTLIPTLLLLGFSSSAPHNGIDHSKPSTTTSAHKHLPSGHGTKYKPYIFRFPQPKPGTARVNCEDVMTNLEPYGFDKAHVHHRYSEIMNGFAADMSDHCVEKLKGMMGEDGVIIEEVQTVHFQAPIPSTTPELTDVPGFKRIFPVKNETKPVMPMNGVQTQANAPWGLQRISQKDMIPIDMGASDKKLALPDYRYSFDESAGEGVDIYVLDTGVNIEHKSFGGRALRNFTSETLLKNKDEGVEDQAGHGTHCAGIAASRDYGVAKKANIIAIKVLSAKNGGSTPDIIRGIEAMVVRHNERKNKTSFRGSVASMSFGLDVSSEKIDTDFVARSPAMELAIMKANAAGIHVVVAAGNQNIDACRSSPSWLSSRTFKDSKFTYNSSVITVGATDIYDNRANFSNFGKCITVYAPGVRILSTSSDGNTSTRVLDGTSMAAPHVSGLVAYFLGKDPSLRNNTTAMKKKIMNIAGKGLLHNIKDERDTKILAFNGVA